MSAPEENVEIVRRWWAPFSGNPESLRSAFPEFWDADADFYPVRKFPEARPCHGLEEISQFLLRYLEAFSRYEATILKLTAVGDDRVLVCAHLHAEGRRSGMNLESDLYQCFWLRHGRFFRAEDHLTLSGALHALGLEGETLEAAGLSHDNLEIARQAWKAYTDHGVDGVLDYFAEDCVVEDFPEMPDRAGYVGRDGVRERNRHFAEIWGDFVIEPVEFIDGGGGVVIVTVTISGHGRTSGAPIDAPTAFVSELRDGKIVRDRAFTSKSQALDAIGLSEHQR